MDFKHKERTPDEVLHWGGKVYHNAATGATEIVRTHEDKIIYELMVQTDRYTAWSEGQNIQIAMSDVSPDDREFILTGMTPQEWEEAFPEED